MTARLQQLLDLGTKVVKVSKWGVARVRIQPIIDTDAKLDELVTYFTHKTDEMGFKGMVYATAFAPVNAETGEIGETMYFLKREPA